MPPGTSVQRCVYSVHTATIKAHVVLVGADAGHVPRTARALFPACPHLQPHP